MAFLIDTDIIIYSIKNVGKVNENIRKRLNEPKSISVITYGELIFGARKSQNTEKNIAVIYRIGELFPIIPVTKDIMNTFGELKATLQQRGNIISDMDLIIASTAINWNYILVTNNVEHFKRIRGLQIENWNE